MKKRATARDWERLRKTGKGLATTDAVTITLWPNAAREIWVRTEDHQLGFKIEFSEGPHGLSARLYFFGGSADVRPDIVAHAFGRYADVTQYRSTDQAQAFKRWYAHEETDADIALLGESYRRKIESEG